MIIDQTIDEATAKYKCVFAGFDLQKARDEYEKAKNSSSNDKKAVQLALHLKNGDRFKNESVVNEGFFGNVVDFLKSPPAWVEEPTGFNDTRPEKVYNDVNDGLTGYRKGEAIGAATAAAVLGKNLIPKVAKAAVKHPIAAGATGYAVTHPEQTAKVADKAAEVVDKTVEVANEVSKHKKLIDKIGDFFAPLTNFAAAHPIAISVLGSVGYGLLATRSLWWPYVQRANYELSSGKVLAAVNFEANGSRWTYEYALNRGKWMLLTGGKVASNEDTVSFSKTGFCQRFIERCREIIEPVIGDQAPFVLASSELASRDEHNFIKDLIKQKNQIRSSMFTGKISL